ncbi:unnamed protein product, partial [marine sediment metagenome]
VIVLLLDEDREIPEEVFPLQVFPVTVLLSLDEYNLIP